MEVRNDYTDDQNYIHIDVWYTEDDSEEGHTAAIVCGDTKKVYFIDNSLRHNPMVAEAITKVLSQLN
jgi:hypothetical protein